MAERRRLLRPAGFDDLGLKRALGDRMLPLLVAAMGFLAALSVAGSFAAASLALHWQEGAAAALTVQVPHDTADPGRATRVLAAIRATRGIADARALSADELDDLLRPWLGANPREAGLALPDVIEVHGSEPGPDLADLARRLAAIAPGTLVESHNLWAQRLAVLARSLQACAWLVLLLVAAVAAAVVTVATRTGLVARRDAIEIVHGLGATDGYIAGRFAARASRLAAIGGTAGALIAVPVLLALVVLAAPFLDGGTAAAMVEPTGATQAGEAAVAATQMALLDWVEVAASLPAEVWLAVPAIPLIAWGLGFATAQVTVRRWLRRLP